jgi:hypothetical protein
VVLIAALLIVAAGCAPAHANHSPGLLERSSVGQINDNGAFDAGFAGASQDGSKVFFVTDDALEYTDYDGRSDIYERSGGTTTRVSTGLNLGSGPYYSIYDGASADGTRVFFSTGEQLASADTDGGANDVYERSGGTTTLVSAGQINGNGDFGADFWAASADGTRVFFATLEQLVGADSDSALDIYERAGGVTTLVSTGQLNGNDPLDAGFLAASTDGTRVFFETQERLTSDDHDTAFDIYQRAGGVTTRASVGEAQSGNNDVFFLAASDDGSRVFFESDERLTADDNDNAFDTFERAAGTTTRVSVGQLNDDAEAIPVAISGDGGHFFFLADVPFVSGDTDSAQDIYERAGGVTTLVSTGPLGGNTGSVPVFAAVTPNGAHVFFTTQEQLVSADTDSAADLYERVGGTTVLVSTGPDGGNGASDASYAGASTDGARVFLHTNEALVSADTDSAQDIYERSAGTTTLVSLGQTGGNGPDGAALAGLSTDGKRAFFHTSESLVSNDTDSATDVYAAREGPGFPRPKGASPLRLSLVPAYQPCLAPNRQHGPPLDFGSCAPPDQASAGLTVGTADANGQPNRFAGYVRLATIVGDPALAGDQADLSVALVANDVRRASDLSDYTGELDLRPTLRLTDLDNGPDAGTVVDLQLSFRVTCTATGDTTAGADCNLVTTADAVVPGVIKESRRTLMGSVDPVRVFDGGADGDLDTPGDNTVFLTQGVFVP